MKEKVAVVFGTFAPLHQGHIDLIQRAKRQCDRVCVIVSGYKGDRGEEVGLPLQKRFRYIREGFSNDELTQIYKLDETELPRYPLGWEPWLKTALETIQYDAEREELIFYVGEKTYHRNLKREAFKRTYRSVSLASQEPSSGKIPASIGNTLRNPSVVSLPKRSSLWGVLVMGRRLWQKIWPASMMHQ